MWALCALAALVSNAHSEPLPQPAISERAFLFTWPVQAPEHAVLSPNTPLVTDRPSFTDASRAVGAGVTLIELGYTYSYDGANRPYTSSHSYPELSLRQGLLANWLELRAVQNVLSVHPADNEPTALDNLELGARFGIAPQFGWWPELSITPHLRLPTGTGGLEAHHLLPGASVSYSWALSDRYSLAGSTQLYQAENSDSHARYAEWLQSAVLTWNATTTVAAWAEIAGFFPSSPAEEGNSYYTDLGVLYLLGHDSQLDLRVGSQLEDYFGRNIFCGVGFSVRYQ